MAGLRPREADLGRCVPLGTMNAALDGERQTVHGIYDRLMDNLDKWKAALLEHDERPTDANRKMLTKAENRLLDEIDRVNKRLSKELPPPHFFEAWEDPIDLYNLGAFLAAHE